MFNDEKSSAVPRNIKPIIKNEVPLKQDFSFKQRSSFYTFDNGTKHRNTNSSLRGDYSKSSRKKQ